MTSLVLRTGVPVEPDAEEARRWAEDELSRGIYSAEPTIFERIWNWIVELFERLFSTDAAAPPNLIPVIVVVGVAVLLAVAFYLAGPLRLQRRRRGASSHTVFDDADATSEQLTAAADAAARNRDWALAVLMRFRAIIRSLDERAILDDRPGLTAHEASSAAAAQLAEQGTELLWAARLFDDVCYGSVRPGGAQDTRLRELASAVARSRPARTTAPDPSWATVR